MLQDLRLCLRTFLKTPTFTVVAVLVLAIGVGANTAIFSAVDAVLLRPLPFGDPDRLVVVWERNIPRDRRSNVASPANFLAWRDAQQTFTDLAALTLSGTSNLTGDGEPEQLRVQNVTATLFPLLGAEALVGRTFLPEEDVPDDTVALVSYRLWQRRFGGDASVVGRSVTIGGRARTIVGVMPPGFSLFDDTVDLWYPAGFDDSAREAGGRYLIVLGRLKPGVTIEAAQAGMDAITANLAAAYPERDAGWASNVVPLHEQVVGDIRPALLLLAGAVGFVLLVACANVANLLLARATARRRELAVRAALGAGRGRLVRQLLTESLMLAGAGGAAGLALAYGGLRVLVTLAASLGIPRLDEAAIDAVALWFTLGLSVVAGVVFGLAPALTASRLDLNEGLRDGARGSDARGGRVRAALVVAEVALSLALLAGAGLLLRSFDRLLSVSPGFRPEGVLTMQVSLSGSKYRPDEARIGFFEELTRRVERLPGVVAAGGISFLPLTGLGSATSFTIVGEPEPPPGEHPVADVRAVSGDYFRAMGIPLVAGRTFTGRERGEAARVIVINEAMAERFWPGQDPIGRKVAISWSDRVVDEVIGVVADVKLVALDDDVRATAYWPHAREDVTYAGLTLAIRTDGDPAALAPAVVAQVRDLEPLQPVANIRTMDEVVAGSVAPRRVVMLLVTVFAAVAVTLAAIGLYGVIAAVVSGRTREIGVRLAIGARPADVLRQVVGQAMRLVGAGIAVGLAGALALTRLIGSQLFGVAPADPVTFGAVIVLLAAVGLAASLVPALRAARVDPVEALRAE